MKRRPKRVAETILREISAFFSHGGVKDPHIGFITFTEVDMSPDLRQAKVYFSVHGSAQQTVETQAALDRAAGFVRRHLGQVLHLKVTPQLQFIYDSSIDYAEHIDKLLDRVHDEASPADKINGKSVSEQG